MSILKAKWDIFKKYLMFMDERVRGVFQKIVHQELEE